MASPPPFFFEGGRSNPHQRPRADSRQERFSPAFPCKTGFIKSAGLKLSAFLLSSTPLDFALLFFRFGSDSDLERAASFLLLLLLLLLLPPPSDPIFPASFTLTSPAFLFISPPSTLIAPPPPAAAPPPPPPTPPASTSPAEELLNLRLPPIPFFCFLIIWGSGGRVAVSARANTLRSVVRLSCEGVLRSVSSTLWQEP